MALTPRNDTAFLREVDEEVRRDQISGFVTRYGKLIAVGLVVLLIALAAFLWWRHDRAEQAGIAGEQYTKALAGLGSGQTAQAKKVMTDLQKSPIKGYAANARLTLAAIALDAKDDKAAIAQYGAAAADTSLPQPYRDLALIRQTTTQFDTLPPATVVARLKPLAEAGNPWFGSAGELVALAYMKMGKRDLAGPLFGAIAKDPNVPESVRTRALRLAGLLGVDAVVPAMVAGKE